MSSQGKYVPSFYIFLTVSVTSLLISFKINTLLETIILAAVIAGIIFLTKTAWEPSHQGKTNVRLRSLQIAAGVAVLQPWWKPLLNSVSKPILSKLPVPVNSTESPSISVLIFMGFVIFIINYYMRDQTAMGKHPTPIEKEFPEKSYQDRLKAFCSYFADDIKKTDRENRWNPDAYIPLEAEVEVQSGTKRLRKVTDLLSAIRSDKKSRAFLVLGDPGSGKSVALRKLCLELFYESEKTGKVPLYINLKEWKVERLWTENAPPTIDELQQFVFNNLIGRGDYYTNEFMKAAFDKMLLHGRFFIILDSFDEIPAVLDEQENSWLIDKLSDITHRFLCGASESRGLLASRLFRRPTNKFEAQTILEIRPLTESKIIALLRKSLSYDKSLVELIFKERQEFVPIARNPFTATLISSYAQTHSNSLPQNQAELYASYIEQNLHASLDRIQRNKLTKEGVVECAINISDVMLTTQTLGLEASISELSTRLPNYPVESVIDVLKYARLGRLGSGDEHQFSFVHRRFNEYFVVIKLIREPERIPKNAIPTDSRWRDALVLYCEVAEEEKVKQIANFCWLEIHKITEDGVDMRDAQFLRMIHCIRFIKEAFRARVSCVEDFREDLAAFIQNILENDNQNILLQKIVIESVGVLRDEDIDTAIIQAVSVGDSWLNETALRACRHLPRISHDLRNAIIGYINSFSPLTLLQKKDDLLFSLNLSNGFIEVRNFLRWRIIDTYTFLLACLVCLAINPLVTPLVVTSCYLIIVVFINILAEIIPSLPSNLTNGTILKSLPSLKNLNQRFLIGIAFLLTQFFIISSNLYLYPSPFWNHLKPLSYLIILFFFPIYYIPYYIFPQVKEILEVLSLSNLTFPSLFRNFIQFLLASIKKFSSELIIYSSMGIIVSFFSMYFGDFMTSFFQRFGTIISMMIALFYGVLLALLPILGLSYYVRDWRNLKRLDRPTSLSRGDIDRQLRVYRTSWGRMEYIKFLQHENIKPSGNWLTSNLPNYKDEASSLLARLEEKWLGLDR